MPHVAALFRYPVKGFTPAASDTLRVQDDGRIAGDRVLAFRFADAATPEERDGLDYWPKAKGLALQDFPALAALRLHFDDAGLRVRIDHGDRVLVEAGLDAEGRRRLTAAVTAFVADSPEGALVAEGPIVRCLATHADPDTGRRDLPVLTTLTRGLGQSEPTLGRLLLPVTGGGVIRVGDEVRPVRAAVA